MHHKHQQQKDRLDFIKLKTFVLSDTTWKRKPSHGGRNTCKSLP